MRRTTATAKRRHVWSHNQTRKTIEEEDKEKDEDNDDQNLRERPRQQQEKTTAALLMNIQI